MVPLGLLRYGKVLLAVAMVFGASQGFGCQMKTKVQRLLPREAEVQGLERAGSIQHFASEHLVEYINGGAELYFAYGFQEMVGCRYHLPDGSNATVEIYEMNRPENAYGVYSFDTDGSHPDVGQEATYAAGLLKFWKGRFFVRILAESDSAETKQILVEIGKNVAEKIDEQGSKPPIVRCVPASGVVPDSLQFFHKQICLNNIYYIAAANLLHLDKSTDAISYRYRVEERSVRVFLVEYPSDAAVSAAFRDFVRTYLERNDAPETEEVLVIQRIENGTFCGVKRHGNFLALVFEASDRDTCQRVLETASSNLERGTSNEEGRE